MADKDVLPGKLKLGWLYRKAQSGMHINDSKGVSSRKQLLNSKIPAIVSASFVYGMHPIHFLLLIIVIFPFAKWAVFVSGGEAAHWPIILVCNAPSDSTCPTRHVWMMQCLSDPLCSTKRKL